MARHRTYTIAFKRQVAQEYLGGQTLHGLSKHHDLSRATWAWWPGALLVGALLLNAIVALAWTGNVAWGPIEPRDVPVRYT